MARGRVYELGRYDMCGVMGSGAGVTVWHGRQDGQL